MTTPSAGWYPDPQNAAQVRWWDGSAWTEHFSQIPTPQPMAAPASPYLAAAAHPQPVQQPMAAARSATQGVPQYAARPEPQSNSLAIAALVVGIVALLFNPGFLMTLAAIVLGSLAVSNANKGLGRKTMAWWGLGLGIASAVTLTSRILLTGIFV